ncbi:uncharacterized protein BNAA10G01230D isoform X3 [Brassica napus]|uniref:uncharacterized protein BNAA10G01230D isoform X3 n=1 Tax=Brassica napus TaxID=3708 RepID=UPI0006AB6C5D|nr:uncharacterized protein BNAA10G01230D isoform X3 [Brassica napus]
MGDVVIFIEDTDMNSSFSRCRICHEEEEAESYFEAPCSCSGTVKFAHRDCIQRWCDEKGNTICEICLQDYKPGYTTTSRPSRLVEATATTRTRRQYGGRRNRRLVDRTESEFPECNSEANRGDSCCRYLALILSVVLLIKNAFDVVYGTDEYPFTIFTVWCRRCFNHLGVLHVQVISCSLYGDDDTWKAWLNVDNSMLHNYYYFYNL